MILPTRSCAVFAVLLCAAPAAAQHTVLLPTSAPGTNSTNYPFGGPRMRYMQWYSAAEWQATAQNPVRVTGLGFRATTPGGQAGLAVDIEVAMANSRPTQPSGSFDSNMVSGRVVVVPRRTVTLGTASPGTFPVDLMFANEFVWDGESGVAVDIKMFDNGNNDQQWQYDLEFNVTGGAQLARMFTIGSPTAVFPSVVQIGSGLSTRFRFNRAIAQPYGQGCPGAGGFVPMASTSGGLPIPGNAGWQHDLTNAASGRGALFWTGLSRTAWDTFALPLDLGVIGAPGCLVQAEPLAFAPTVTAGGGPGMGTAAFVFPVPQRTDFLGVPFYSQWLVVDPNAPNGFVAVSNAVVSVADLQ